MKFRKNWGLREFAIEIGMFNRPVHQLVTDFTKVSPGSLPITNYENKTCVVCSQLDSSAQFPILSNHFKKNNLIQNINKTTEHFIKNNNKEIQKISYNDKNKRIN